MTEAKGKAPALDWNPWKVYDLTEREMKAIKEKAKFRAAMKTEFQMKSSNPYQKRLDGHIFDPAVQRHMAMRATEAHFFKPNFKTASLGIAVYILPLFSIYYYGKYCIAKYEKKCRSGELAYKDRRYKFV